MEQSEQEIKQRKLTASQFYANFNISDENDRLFIGDAIASTGSASSETPGPSTTVGTLKNIQFKKQSEFYGGTEGEDPIHFFNFFFGPELLSSICEYTNNNARLILENPNISKTSLLRKWTDLTADELRIFLGLLFHMGTISLYEFRDYWSRDRLFQLPTFVEQMSRDRFLIIIRFLKFTNVPVQDSYDEIRSLIEYFNETMLAFYYPGRELLFTDNVLIRKGRVVFNHHNKVNKKGYKFFMLSEPDGLILKLHVHPGGEGTNPEVSNSVLKDIMKNHLHNGHALYTNICYQGYVIAKHFLDKETYYTGMLERLPEKYKDNALKTLKLGESTAIFRDNVHIGTWRGVQPISYITSEYNTRMKILLSKSGHHVRRPEVVVKFKEIMKTRDRQKEMVEFYPCRQKQIKSYLKAAIHVFQLMLMNSHKIYNKCSIQPKKSFREFRLAVINKLLPMKSRQKVFIWEGHTLRKFERKNSMGQTYRKACRQCLKIKGKRKDSVWCCIGCPSKPPLCVECFNDYHVQLNEDAT